MKKFQVITDSTSDVEKKFRDQLELDYFKMTFKINEKEYDADLDWNSGLSPKEYYDMMRKGLRSVTSMVKADEVENKIDEAFAKGLDVLYIACSGKLSGSCSNAKIYAEDVIKKYPDRKVVFYDSLRSNYAEGKMAMDAAQMALDGKELDEVVAYLDENKLKYQTFATVGTLTYLKNAGRVKAGAAFFGNIMGVKPIIVGDAKGNNYAYKKVKGRRPALDDIAASAIERIEKTGEQTLFIEHADCEADALYIKEKVAAAVKCNINVSILGPIIGATTGPDTITLNFFGQKMEIAGEE